MLNLLLQLALKFWKPIAAFLGGLGLYFKGRVDRGTQDRLKGTEKALQRAEQLTNVKTNATRDAALARLRKSGHVRED